MAISEIPQTPTTAAFFLQSAIAFGVSLATAVVGVFYLPIDAWQRGFLAITLLFLTSSTFTLAKVVRDRQEQTSVRARLDEARVDKLIAEHDPFSKVSWPGGAELGAPGIGQTDWSMRPWTSCMRSGVLRDT